MTTIMLRLTLLFYVTGALLYVLSLLKRRVHPARYATWILAGAFIVHSGLIASLWWERGYIPLVTRSDVLSFFAWSLTGCFLLFQFHTKTRVLGLSVAPVSLVFLLLASPGISTGTIVPPLFKTSLIYLHVFMSILGEALFIIAALAGGVYLIQDGLLKGKTITRLTRYLPPLKDLDRINEWALTWGLVSLTIGIIAGVFGAQVNWEGTWHLDSKILWSWGAWCLLAILVHQRLAIGWTGRRPAAYTLGCSLILIGTFLLQAFLFPSIHRFF